MLCRELLGLQPRLTTTGGGTVLSKDDRVKQILDELLEKLPDEFPLVEICSRLEEKTPFMVVIVQECERVNGLLIEAKRSLRELDKGLKVCAKKTSINVDSLIARLGPSGRALLDGGYGGNVGLSLSGPGAIALAQIGLSDHVDADGMDRRLAVASQRARHLAGGLSSNFILSPKI